MKNPKIVNIDNLTSRTPKDALIHMTNAQWKKAISKAKKYKGKKDLGLNRVTFNFIPISDEFGGLLNVTFKTKNGQTRRILPHVKRISGDNQIVFLDNETFPTTPCISGINADGKFYCWTGTCRSGCDLICGKYNAACVCGNIGTGPLVVL